MLWLDEDAKHKSIRGAVQPIVSGLGDIADPHIELLNPRIALLPGDIRLSEFEAELSDAWPRWPLSRWAPSSASWPSGYVKDPTLILVGKMARWPGPGWWGCRFPRSAVAFARSSRAR
jgi:hypothetical protein